MDNKYTTATGRVITFEPISVVALEKAELGLQNKYRRDGKPIDPPTYDVEIVGGGKQTFIHDVESVKGNPEWEAQWQAHLTALQELNTETNKIRNEMVFDAIQIDPAEMEGWQEKQVRWNIEIPSDPLELKIHYIQTVVLKSVKDVYGIVNMVMALSMEGVISQEEIEAASKSFRDSMVAAKREAEELVGTENQEGALDAQRQV
jgi:hypothetical protein